MHPKKDLIRIVRSPEGEVSIDIRGKKSGRGAYVCYNEQCLTRALKQKQLDRALDIKVDEALSEELILNIRRMEREHVDP